MRTLATGLIVLTLAAGCGSARVDSSGPTQPASSPAPAPAEVVLTCSPGGGEISTPTVAAQPDGVHVRVVNTSDTPLVFQWQDGGENAPVGASDHLITVAPGDTRIGCADADGNNPSLVALAVSDPGSVYSATAWTCTARSTGVLDYAAGSQGVPESQLPDAAREAFKDAIQDGDAIQPAGYPQGDYRSYQLVRDGQTVAQAEFMPDGHDGWLLSTNDRCS